MNFIENIKRGTETFIGEEELEQRLNQDKPLRVKLGVDPTAPILPLDIWWSSTSCASSKSPDIKQF